MKKEFLINEEDVPLSSLLKNVSNELSNSDLSFNSASCLDLRTVQFMKKFFPEAKEKDWLNWKWQLSNSITTISKLSELIELTEDELKAVSADGTNLPLRITPYYAALFAEKDFSNPIRRAVVPLIAETLKNEGEADDPLCEEHDSPVSGIVHRYPDRVLFLATGFCSTYCRYCTRSRIVGDSNKLHNFNTKIWEEAFNYIKNHKEIRDVIVSGGDPLTMSDSKIDYLLSRLREIKHIEIIRIGTKVPAVLPQRITPKLINILKKYHPLFMSIHFTHPDEITNETKLACIKLADAGLPLGSQTVLLKGINDSVETMKSLFHKLLKIRVRPYYLYQCDPVSGSSHFRTTVQKGLDIIKGIRGHTSGYAVPHFVVDAPGGGGKIPLIPDYFQEKNDDFLVLKNYEDRIFRYPDTKK